MTKLFGSLALAGTVALAQSMSTGETSASAHSARSGDLHLIKNCSAYTGDPGFLMHVNVLEPRGDPGRLKDLL